MSKEQLKKMFENDKSTWEAKTMHDFVEGLFKDIGAAKDFIVEENTNINGTYEKWASGKLVCYGYVQKAVDNAIKKPFPHEFAVQLPIMIITPKYVGGQNTSLNYHYVAFSSYTDASVFVRDVRTGEIPTSGEASFSYIAIGRYK